MRVAAFGPVVLMGALAGCVTESQPVLSAEPVALCLTVQTPSQQVFHSAQEMQAFADASGGGVVPDVDFQRRMVVAHFDGPGSYCTSFSAEGVAVEDERVVVHLTRHLYDGPCILLLAYPQIALSVERRDLPVVFEIAEAHTDRGSQASACQPAG